MVIIGAGECGARAAFALREHGYQGPVTLVGDEPHHPYERPPLSKDVLSLDDAPPPKWVSTPRDLCRERHRLHHRQERRGDRPRGQDRALLRRHVAAL